MYMQETPLNDYVCSASLFWYYFKHNLWGWPMIKQHLGASANYWKNRHRVCSFGVSQSFLNLYVLHCFNFRSNSLDITSFTYILTIFFDIMGLLIFTIRECDVQIGWHIIGICTFAITATWIRSPSLSCQDSAENIHIKRYPRSIEVSGGTVVHLLDLSKAQSFPLFLFLLLFFLLSNVTHSDNLVAFVNPFMIQIYTSILSTYLSLAYPPTIFPSIHPSIIGLIQLVATL